MTISPYCVNLNKLTHWFVGRYIWYTHLLRISMMICYLFIFYWRRCQLHTSNLTSFDSENSICLSKFMEHYWTLNQFSMNSTSNIFSLVSEKRFLVNLKFNFRNVNSIRGFLMSHRWVTESLYQFVFNEFTRKQVSCWKWLCLMISHP